jgi:hypothetical protein
MSSNNTYESNDICLKLEDAITQNFNNILDSAKIEKLDFESIKEVLNKLVEHIGVSKKKNEKLKRCFSKFLGSKSNILDDNLFSHFKSNTNLINCFANSNDDSSTNWNYLYITVVSYLSYLKQLEHKSDEKSDLNYRGMIDKLMNKIEEFEESDSSNDNSDSELSETNDPQKMLKELKKQMPTTEKAPTVIKGLLGDIKHMLTNNDGMDTKNIVDFSKDLSSKYQNMIESGEVNINDLLSGVIGLLNDPDALDGEFSDIDATKLPDVNDFMSGMANDPNLKQAMSSMMGKDGKLDMNNLMSSMMGSMGSMGGMGGNDNPLISGLMNSMMSNNSNVQKTEDVPKTIEALEEEIRRMMNDLQVQESPLKLEDDSSHSKKE